jgi:hypothetical protein
LQNHRSYIKALENLGRAYKGLGMKEAAKQELNKVV